MNQKLKSLESDTSSSATEITQENSLPNPRPVPFKLSEWERLVLRGLKESPVRLVVLKESPVRRALKELELLVLLVMERLVLKAYKALRGSKVNKDRED
jgi:hypothetical protein